MSHRSIIVLLIAVTQASCQSPERSPAVSAPVEGPHSVTVLIDGAGCGDCTIRVALFESAASWLKAKQPYRGRLMIFHSKPQRLTFYGLPAGRYAVAAYVDRNDNARLDRWFGLLPKEPLAYSRVAGRRLPPGFAESAFDVPTSATVPVSFSPAQRPSEQP